MLDDERGFTDESWAAIVELGWTGLLVPESAGGLGLELDEEVALEMVKGFGGVVTQLTQQQAEYIGVPQQGPFKPHAYRY
jgi:alkylation response protein AidB-like acyl-CoA dehydrogenase